jgi:hypothetical protein
MLRVRNRLTTYRAARANRFEQAEVNDVAARTA